MFKRKLVALSLGLAMVASLAACGDGGSKSASKTTASNPNATKIPTKAGSRTEAKMQSGIDDHSAISADCIAGFEDGNSGFISINEADWSKDVDLSTEVIDKFDSKMFVVNIPNGGKAAVAIDIVGLLGDNASKASYITIDLGLDCKNDKFASASGNVLTYAGEANTEIKTNFAIFKREATVKTYKIELGDLKLTEGNYITFDSINDTATEKSGLLIDNIIAYDANGAALPLDTSVKFAVNGVGEFDWSNSVKAPTDEKLVFTGVPTGTGWWPEVGNSWCWTNVAGGDHANCFSPDTFAFGEGDVLTVYYTIADPENTANYQQVPYIRIKNVFPEDSTETSNKFGEKDKIVDVFVDSAWNVWEDDLTPAPEALVNESRTIVQIPYELFAQCIEDAGCDPAGIYDLNWLGIADRGAVLKISAVTVGKQAQ